MQTNPLSLARKFLLGLAAGLALALLAGCETVTLTNLTPPSMPANPSQIYTFQLRVTPHVSTITSLTPHIVLDGKNFEMQKSKLGAGIYEFEFQLPQGRDEMRYYYLVNYMVENNGQQTPAEAYTEVTAVKVVSRYVLSLEVNRGPVGARISVVGRGFTQGDTVYFSGTQVPTNCDSPNALSFNVPALEAGKDYSVALMGANGTSPIGTFHIDPSTVSVMPQSLTLRTHEQQSLTFTIANAAPAGGTLLDVSTDVPESVIMPEVVVPPGQTSVTVNVEGGRAGSGNLFLKGYGTGELTIPVTVTAR